MDKITDFYLWAFNPMKGGFWGGCVATLHLWALGYVVWWWVR